MCTVWNPNPNQIMNKDNLILSHYVSMMNFIGAAHEYNLNKKRELLFWSNVPDSRDSDETKIIFLFGFGTVEPPAFHNIVHLYGLKECNGIASFIRTVERISFELCS